jgi:hypothetical protein
MPWDIYVTLDPLNRPEDEIEEMSAESRRVGEASGHSTGRYL